MMRKILPLIIVEILILSGLGVVAVSSNTLRHSQSLDEVESEFQNEKLDSLLSTYGLDTGDTMGEFEQILYNLASKRRWINPSLSAKLINDVDELSDKLEQIGVKDDMTIAEALSIIENNKEQMQEEGINLFCSIDMYAYGGACWPIYRYYKALFGWWGIGHIPDHVTIKGLTGLQHCEDNGCKDNYEGTFIGLIGSNPPVMYYFYQSASQETWIRGDFVLLSRSNLPFVNYTGGSQQTLCPCNQPDSQLI